MLPHVEVHSSSWGVCGGLEVGARARGRDGGHRGEVRAEGFFTRIGFVVALVDQCTIDVQTAAGGGPKAVHPSLRHVHLRRRQQERQIQW